MNGKTWLIGATALVVGFTASHLTTLAGRDRGAPRVEMDVAVVPQPEPALASTAPAGPQATYGALSPQAALQIQSMVQTAVAQALKDARVDPAREQTQQPTEQARKASEQGFARGQEIVEGALERGVWDDAAATALRDVELEAGMLGEHSFELHRRIANAINHDAIEVTAFPVL